MWYKSCLLKDVHVTWFCGASCHCRRSLHSLTALYLEVHIKCLCPNHSPLPSPAQSVVLDDGSFLPEEFAVEQGLLSASWDRIPQYPPLL